jgi:hypothetical protein
LRSLGTNRSKLETQKHYVALFRLQAYGCVVNLRVLLETWSQTSGQKAISVTLSQGDQPFDVGPELRASSCGKPSICMTWFSLSLTNRIAYIWFKGEEVCCKWGICISVGRNVEPLLAGLMRRRYKPSRAFCFHFRRQRPCFLAAPEMHCLIFGSSFKPRTR